MTRRGRKEGSIFKRADGRWSAQLDLGYAGGKRNRKVFYGHTRAEVSKKLDEARALVRDGLQIPAERYTVGQLISEWLDDTASDRAARTNERYRTMAELHVLPHVGHLRLRQFGPQDIENLQKTLRVAGLAPRTILKARTILSGALGRAERWRLIPRNPVDLEPGPQVKKAVRRILSRTEARRFIDLVRGDRLEALYLVVIAMGVRRGEALGLRWRDVDWAEGSIEIVQQLQRIEHGGGRKLLETKTDAGQRKIYLPPIAVAKLIEHRDRQEVERAQAGEIWQDYGLVFASIYGTPMEPRNLNRSFAEVRKNLQADSQPGEPLVMGIPDLTLHGLRHSATSLYLALGVPPHVVQSIIGHTDPAVTLGIYAHALNDDHRSAAALMDEALFGARLSTGLSNESPAAG